MINKDLAELLAAIGTGCKGRQGCTGCPFHDPENVTGQTTYECVIGAPFWGWNVQEIKQRGGIT